MNGQDKRTKKVALYGLLTALAFVLGYIEALLPVPMPVPGMKLGLANMASVAALYLLGWPSAVFVTLARIVLSGFTFTNLSMMLYSLSGGILSLAVMGTLKKCRLFSVVGVSVAGGAAHNIGQLLMAALVVRTAGVFAYLPALLAAGTLAGAAVGLAAGAVMGRVRRALSGGMGQR